MVLVVFQEEIRDLLVFDGERHVISVREVPGGGVCLAGASERGVKSKEETADLLSAGSLTRATAATGMNAQSSRSHAIFTITVEQKKQLRFANEKLQVGCLAGNQIKQINLTSIGTNYGVL